MAKTSLQRSHSVASNFKLTLICLLLAISLSAVWFGIILINHPSVDIVIGIVVTAVSAVVALISFLLLSKFTR